MFDALTLPQHGILGPVKSVTAAFVSACLLFVTACTGESAVIAPPPPLTYGADGISFTYPAGWDLLADITAAEGPGATGPVVGYLDAAGNLIGLAVDIQSVDPPVPDGEERSYLDAAFSRYAAEIWVGGTVREEGWSVVDGRHGILSVVDHTARGEPLTSEVLAAVEGSTLVVIQCQAPIGVFGLLAPRCVSVIDSLRIEWDGDDSTSGEGS